MNHDIWEDYSLAEDVFYAKRMELFASKDFESRLASALRSPEGSERALRVLLDARVDHSFALSVLSELIELAVSGPTRSLDLASQVLARQFSDDEVRSSISEMIENYYKSSDYFLLRRLAQVLRDHHLDDLLLTLVSNCRNHDDPDIREISDDFSPA